MTQGVTSNCTIFDDGCSLRKASFEPCDVVNVASISDSTHSLAPSNSENGPSLIREASTFISGTPYLRDGIIDRESQNMLCSGVTVVDGGDFKFPRTREDLLALWKCIRPRIPTGLQVMLLGDDACNFPVLVQRTGVIVHVDAHDDQSDFGDGLTHANFLRRILERSAGLEAVQFGLREMKCPERQPRGSKNTRQVRSLDELSKALGAYPRGTPCAVCIDCDVLDPAVFPFVACPEPGGLRANDVLQVVQTVSRSPVITDTITLSEFSVENRSKESLTAALGIAKLIVRSIDALISESVGGAE